MTDLDLDQFGDKPFTVKIGGKVFNVPPIGLLELAKIDVASKSNDMASLVTIVETLIPELKGQEIHINFKQFQKLVEFLTEKATGSVEAEKKIPE